MSDVDLLLLGDVPESELELLRDRYPRNPSFSGYTWDEIAGMIEYGSVFLHHVRLEGRPLVEHGAQAADFHEALRQLPSYRFLSRDLAAFRDSVADVRASMQAGGSAPYELGVLATTIRHAAILGCYVASDITFGRSEALAKVVRAWRFDEEWAQRFIDLYGFALHDQRTTPLPWEPDACDTGEWADFADQLLDRLEVSIEDFQNNMPEAA